MSKTTANRVFTLLALAMAITLSVMVLTFDGNTDRVEILGQQIKCPVCQGESIGDSPAQMARDMMALVRQRVDEGHTDTEIIDELLGSYSGAVLLDPPASGATLLLWVGPAIAVLVGIGVIVWWKRHPGETDSETETATPPKPRRLAPILFLSGALALIVIAVGFFVQDRDGPATGVAAIDTSNLDEVSNETMEAVVAANEDHPEVDGMRLALAERYVEEGNFSSAFPHYLAVAESQDASNPQVVEALVRLGWMAWEGNQEAETAIGLFDQALSIDATAPTAKFLKGQVLWCAALDRDLAANLFSEILADPDITNDTRALVESELNALQAGAACT